VTRTAAAIALAAVAVASSAEEPVDLDMINRIRDEGLNRSKVMETAAYLTDSIGPRLTNSPQARRASEWTRDRLSEWGVANAHLEAWGPFGRGWSFEHATVTVVAPVSFPIIAVPEAWTPGTSGAVRGPAMKVKVESEADLEALAGQLSGKVLLISEPREIQDMEKALFERLSAQELETLSVYGPERRRTRERLSREEVLRRSRLQKRQRSFFKEQGVLATLKASERERGIVRVGGAGSREASEDPGVPGLVVAAEQYNRLARLVAAGGDVQVEVDVRARFHDDDVMGHNTIAEIPGTDRRGEVVMVGAHLDSWHAGTGATDNGAGVSVAMEAMRILRALDVKPRRTIRIGLWTGEEQGLLGSRAYVAQHFATRPDPTPEERELPSYLRRSRGPLTLKPEHALFSAYFNLDNGTGRVRGVYTQQNVAAAPIFEAWLRPLADLGANTISNRDTSGTDHQAFDGVGLPGFQFIQDDAEYSTVTHHTNLDVFDRLQKDDLMQASVVMATFAYHAAMREGRFPRKPLPADPAPAASPAPGASPAPAASPAASGPARGGSARK
jgi:carboxypeptidase Q